MFDTLKLIYTQDEALELVSRYEKVYNEKIEELEEENKKLKKNIAWYEKEEDRLREENKNLKEELEWYKKQYEHSMWED